MKRNGFTILAVLVFALGTFGLAYPNSGYWDNFKLAYSTSPLTNPPITNSAGQNCMVCHTGWPTTRAGVGTVNAYGNDYANANYNFGAIINNDPDGDGYTNLQEITAGTYPGDATSHPSAADTTPPVVGAFSIPATSTSLTVGITTFTATDVGGVTGYLLTETSTLPASPSWVATKPTSYTFASAGNKTLYAWAKDAAGNISVPLSASTTITLPDTIAPVVTGFSIPATSSSLTVAISSLTATDVGGVTGYMVTANSTIPGTTGWSITPPASYTFSTAGPKTLYAWAKDAAGNISVPLSASTTITLPDTIAPVVTGFSIPATSSSLTVAISSLTATDVGGVTGYMVTANSTIPGVSDGGWSSTAPTSYTFASAGAKTLYAWAKDAAGNVSVPLSAATTITSADVTAPMVTGFSIPATSSSLTVAITTFTATDDVGVTGYLVTETSTLPASPSWVATKPASYTFASAGAKTLYAWAKDAAGNVSLSFSAATTITSADVTAPMVTGFSIPATSSSLTVAITTFTATDDVGVTGYLVTEISATPSASAAAGWNGSAPASYTFPSAGAKRLYAWAKDAAGNISASMSQTIALSVSDTTPPVITNFRVPSRSSSPIIPVTLTATDDQGVTGYLVTEAAAKPTAADPRWRTTAPTSYTCSSGGYRTLHAWAKDAAGNISTGASRTMAVQWSGRTHRSDDERSDDRSRDD